MKKSFFCTILVLYAGNEIFHPVQQFKFSQNKFLGRGLIAPKSRNTLKKSKVVRTSVVAGVANADITLSYTQSAELTASSILSTLLHCDL